MVPRSYHDYSTNALRELSCDLNVSQVQLQDQRADYVKRPGSEDAALRQVEVLINNLGDQRAAVDRELVARHREATAAAALGHRDVARRAGHGRRTYSAQGIHAKPKPHCRAKRMPAAVQTPR
jgi:hypothetical protein